jgi:branched-chain amino acid transport system permease protein
VLGGNMFITEPGMAAAVGTIVFVVVVFGGMGSLTGAFIASLLIGGLQTFSVALDYSLADFFRLAGVSVGTESALQGIASITISQTAPVLPYLLMVLMLIVRPRGLMGTRES